jgi:hypothetical protein
MSTTLRELLARGRRVLTPGPAVPSPRVDRLLDSLRAPATSEELDREDAAVAAFHRARLVSSAPVVSHRGSPHRAGLKAATAAAAAVALLSTGAAFAATGHTPWSHHALEAAAPSKGTSTHATPTHPGKPTDDATSGGPHAHAYWGLCHAYTAGNKATHGRALSSPAFAALVEAAGGTGQVASFCATVRPPRDSMDESSETAEPTEGQDPSDSTEDASPTHPTHPSHPVEPTDGASPTHPTHPTHPSHPSHSSEPTGGPTHPTHPTRQSRP